MYTFELQREENVRIDLLFKDADGDLDIELFDENFNEIADSNSASDDETIEQVLPRGGTIPSTRFLGAQNSYRIFRGSGEFGTTRTEVDVENGMIPDAMGDEPGVLEIPVTFPNAPPGSIVRNLVIRRLLITHPFLPNLRVSGKWDAEELAVFWNQQGDAEGGDNGEDDDNDDFLPGFSTDLDFGHNFFRSPQFRTFSEFAGRATNGQFILRIEDRAAQDVGELEKLEIEIEYFAP